MTHTTGPAAEPDPTPPSSAATNVQPCGTPAAYLRHWRHGEPIDDACKAAKYAYDRTQKERARESGRHRTPCTCGRPRPAGRYTSKWCGPCYQRWLRAGKPQDGPPPSRRDVMASVREDYCFLRENGEGLASAAQRLGIALTTAYHWEKDRKAAA